MQRRRNPTFWLYVIGIYVLIQFLWWAWLLIDQSGEIAVLAHESDPDFVLNRRILMVIGEGLVFIVLVLYGFKKLRDSIHKEVKLAHAQQNFLLSVTHELNTPLASVILYLQTLKNRKLDPERQQEVLSKSLVEADRLKALVDNILTSTRIEENQLILHPESHDLSVLLSQSLEPFIEQYGRERFDLQLEPEVLANIDPLAFHSILQNLIENALKYSGEQDMIQVSLSSKTPHAVLEICDQGIGIPAGSESAIFDKFYRVQSENTRSTKGTGLGLFIVKNLVDMMNGKISYRPNTPKGSIFTLQIPLSWWTYSKPLHLA